jgi:hypothetical protein
MAETERTEWKRQPLGHLDEPYCWLNRRHRKAGLFDRLLFPCASAVPSTLAKLALWPS